MYIIMKYNYVTGAREEITRTEDAVEAFNLASSFDAKYKVGADENDPGEPNMRAEIEDENGVDKWQECSSIACPPVGMFN